MKFRVKGGFSLVEVLVVVALLGGLSIAISRSFFSQMRGVDKTQQLLELRQAGDHALSVIKKKSRNALSATCPGSTSLSLKSRDPAAQSYDTFATIATEFVCSTGAGGKIEMIEDGSTTQLTPGEYYPDSCDFSCSSPPGEPTRVEIEFKLTDSENEQDFAATVSLRNF